MAMPPDGPQPPERAETDLDPEDEFQEVDEEGFLVDEGHGWGLSGDLDAWAMWAAIVAVAWAAFQTLATLAVGGLDGWGPDGFAMPLPLPAGYLSLILLGGVLVLAIRRDADASAGRGRWVRAAACLAAGTGSCLAVAQLAGNIGVIVRSPGAAFGEPVATAANVVAGVGGFADVVAAALPAVMAVVLFRWSRGHSEGEAESGTKSARPASAGPALGAVCLGACVAAAAFVGFQAGSGRNPNEQLSIPPSAPSFSLLPVISLVPATPMSGQVITLPSGCTREASGACIGGAPVIEASPSPSPVP